MYVSVFLIGIFRGEWGESKARCRLDRFASSQHVFASLELFISIC